MRKIGSLLIRISISVCILFFLLKQIDLNKLIEIFSCANKTILTLTLLIFLLIHTILFFRWRMLLIGLELNLPPILIFRSFCLGLLSNLVFPSTIGGDFIRSIDLSLRTKKPRLVVASVILDRLSGYSALMVVVLFAFTLGHKAITDRAVLLVLSIICIFLGGGLLILFNNFIFMKLKRILLFFGGIGRSLSNLHYEIYNFRNQKNIIIRSSIYSLIIQLMFPFTIYLVSLALGVKVNLIYFFIFIPIITIISALPVSIAGLGLREASSMYFFTRVGMADEAALAISLMTFLFYLLIGLSGGIIYVLTFSYRRLQCNKTV